MQLKNSNPIAIDVAQIDQAAAEAAELLSVLANANRLKVLCHLYKEEMPVGELADAVGMSQPALSQQLSKLRDLKLVATRREGRTIYYRLASPMVVGILATLYELFCSD
ncbi:MAG: ArsR/SmtB family transcription factor [Rhizobiaceae bacterium]